jgi:hypothetical protein
VLLAQGRRDDPSPKPLCDDPLAADRIRASGRQHPIQDRHADGSLGLPGRETTGAQSRSDQNFATAYCRFDQRASTVAGRRLPRQPSPVRNHLQMAVTLCGRTRFTAGDGRRARRDHHFSMSSPCAAIVR